MSYIEVLTDNGLTVEQWENSIYDEYIGMLQWKHFMGTSSDAIIQVKQDLSKKKGDAITIGMRGRVVGGRVDGNAMGVGNEGTMSFFNQRIEVDNVRRLVKMTDVPMSNQRVMFSVLEEARDALQQEFMVDLDDDITEAMSDTSAGRVQGRYLYGALDSNYNATHSTALANVDSSDDKLTAQIIGIAKRKATIPTNALVKIRPFRVKNGKNYEQWYVFMGHSYPIRDITQSDAVWKNVQLNLPPRGESPITSGSAFKGAYDGVLIYENDRLLLEDNAGASSIDVAHNLLLGAQAGAVCWAQRSKFGEEEEDVGHNRIYELHEIRGIEKLVFDRSTPEDNGVVHVFTSGVADS